MLNMQFELLFSIFLFAFSTQQLFQQGDNDTGPDYNNDDNDNGDQNGNGMDNGDNGVDVRPGLVLTMNEGYLLARIESLERNFNLLQGKF